MKSCSQSPPGGLWGQVGREGRDGLRVVARVVRKLHSDRLRCALRDRPVQLLNCALGFDPLVESDESNAL